MCTVHVLMRFCHRVDRSFVCKAKEGRHVRITNNQVLGQQDILVITKHFKQVCC